MIILLDNIYKTAIWGGNNLQKLFNINSPFEITSEIWTASAHENGQTPIKIFGDNSFQINSLQQLYHERKNIFGSNCEKYQEFPLLAKWIDANDKLSVQVHPNDEYARINHNSFGKTEAWYIVSAKPNAQIVYGLQSGIQKESFVEAIQQNKIEEDLQLLPVKDGQIFYIPSGTVHALLDGVVVYEIQQSSDITYRLFDWNRVGKDGKPRQLHIDQALDVINFDVHEKYQPEQLSHASYPYFEIEKREVTGKTVIQVESESFKLCSIVKGTLDIQDNNHSVTLEAGQSFILPASIHQGGEQYQVNGNAVLLESICK